MLEDPTTLVPVLFPTSDSAQVKIITFFSMLEHKPRMKEKVRQGNVYRVSGRCIVMTPFLTALYSTLCRLIEYALRTT